MISAKKKALASLMNNRTALVVDDVFSTYLTEGTGSAQTITTGIDLVDNDGSVWGKAREDVASVARSHTLRTTVRGFANSMRTDHTGGSYSLGGSATSTGFITSVAEAEDNSSGYKYAFWSFLVADNFYHVSEVVKSSSTDTTVDLSALGTVGMVRVKRTDSTGSWYVWHKDLTAGKLLIGETTAAETTLGHITVSGTTLTLVDGVIADGTYLVEAFAHDTSEDGFIQCGSYTGTPSTVALDLDWEPQFFLSKKIDGTEDWAIVDSMRGFTASVSSAGIAALLTNTSASEETPSNSPLTLTPTGLVAHTGYDALYCANGGTYIYVAIRRSMRVPEAGTDIFAVETYSGNATSGRLIGAGFAVDLTICATRTHNSNNVSINRLTGANNTLLMATSPAAENGLTNRLIGLDNMSGIEVGTDSDVNAASRDYIQLMFKRAPGFMDMVAYNGTGSARTEPHGLRVVPEMKIVKSRSGSTSWEVYHKDIGNTSSIRLEDNSVPAVSSTFWNDTSPTATEFTIGTSSTVNGSGATYTAILFATLPGISKVGSFNHENGTPTDVDCGFTSGARLALVKRTDDVGDWYLWDTERGIVAGNDPFLLLNSTAVENTSTDYIDPLAIGFQVASDFATGDYIFLAIA